MKRWTVILVLLLSGMAAAHAQGTKNPYEGYSLVIYKGSFTISLVDAQQDTLYTFPVATGEMPGQKTRPGDCKTPQGTFKVTWVQNTRGVMYDYHDGKGLVEAYGPYFIHLETPGFKAIGVHGTCPERDDRIGTRDSKGCIRLHNRDLLTILPYVHPGMDVKIVPGFADIWYDFNLRLQQANN